MKKLISLSLLLLSLPVMGQTERGPVTTSPLGRALILEDSVAKMQQLLGIGTNIYDVTNLTVNDLIATNVHFPAGAGTGKIWISDSVGTGHWTYDGGTLTNITAPNLIGIVPDVNLSTNVPRKNDATIHYSGTVIFDGTASGNGGGLTNLNATNLIGKIPSTAITNVNALGLTNLPTLSLTRDFGVTGTGDETAKLQAALNCSRPVLVDSSVTVGNCFITNGSYLIGDGHSVIYQGTSFTGDCLAVTSSNVANFHLDRIVVDGLNFGALGFGGVLPWTFITNATGGYVVISGSVARTGIHIGSTHTNSSLINCTVRGFTVYGYEIDGWGNTFPQPTLATTQIIGCSAANCWNGFIFLNSGEYVILNGCYANSCGRGLAIFAGNEIIQGGEYSRNGVAAWVDGNVSNPAHGLMQGCVFNHNEISVVATGFPNGEMFDHCLILAQGVFGGLNNIFLTNCAGVTFDSCYISGIGAIYNDGGAGNFLGPNRMSECVSQAPIPVNNSNGGVMLSDGMFIIGIGSPTLRTNNFTNIWTGTATFAQGVNSTLTNTAVMTLTGLTNTNSYGLRIFSFTNLTAWYSNTVSGVNSKLPTNFPYLEIQSGEAIFGTGCVASNVVAF